MPKITGFVTGLTLNKLPYCTAILECGHTQEASMQPMRGRCLNCNTVRELEDLQNIFCSKCHHTGFVITFSPDRLNPNDRLSVVGDQVECPVCINDNQELSWLKNLDPKTVHHVRFRPHFGGRYWFYKLDDESPSGFRSIGATHQTLDIDKVLSEKGLSPLSPTESA